MTKLITILIVLVVLLCGWQLYKYWEKVEAQKEDDQKQAQGPVTGEQLPGLSWQYAQSYQNAVQKGPAAVKAWLDANSANIQDPRKAWMELDYVVSVARENTAEAKRVFAEVKRRVPPSSPVYPRIKKLAKTYE